MWVLYVGLIAPLPVLLVLLLQNLQVILLFDEGAVSLRIVVLPEYHELVLHEHVHDGLEVLRLGVLHVHCIARQDDLLPHQLFGDRTHGYPVSFLHPIELLASMRCTGGTPPTGRPPRISAEI